MLLTDTRDVFGDDFTLGVLRVTYEALAYDGRRWVPNVRGPIPLDFAFVCEDEDRGMDASNPATLDRKVPTDTAIPVGRYRIARTWSPKYQRAVMQLLDVPRFRGIRVHAGNDEADTEGCPLPGLSRNVARGTVSKSAAAVAWLDARYLGCAIRGEEVWWEVRRDAEAWDAALRRTA